MTSAGSAEVPPRPQAVLGPLTRAAIFLVVTVDAGGEDTVRGLLADLSGLVKAVGFRSLDGGLSCVAGIGSRAWDRLYGRPKPPELHELPVFAGDQHKSVTTKGDLLFHLRAERMDLCFELETQLMVRLAGAVTVADETQGFRYFDARDVLGFVDGTENPTGPDASDAVLADDGGSYVIVQKYLHDMTAWNALSTEDQEMVIGRRKLSDIELSDEEKPSNSHVALNTITEPDGTEREILRDNMPFGRPAYGEFGTYFIGYAKTPSVTERMLENMFVGSPPGNYDRILDFSTPVTGTLFYVPTAEFLDNQPETQPESLGIGSLRRSQP
ncbi:Dyp-type peroxidase [Fodinicola acaciae]|uniref:Dyp-type peroxidase n=1 Tax=Fodinicola acaciae TaxID=2681555 RepID=UPI0013D7F57F